LAYFADGSFFIQIFAFTASGLQKTYLFCNRVRSGSSKVVDFGTNRKRICDFLLVVTVRHSNGHILHGFWDPATYWLKIANFSYPSFIRRPRSLCSLWMFAV